MNRPDTDLARLQRISTDMGRNAAQRTLAVQARDQAFRDIQAAHENAPRATRQAATTPATRTPTSEQRLATLNRRAGTLISAMGADLRYTPAQRAQAQNALARLTAEQQRIRSQSATTRQSRSGRISELKQQIKDYQRGVKSNQRNLAKLQREMNRLFSRRRYNGRSGESISRDMRHIEDNLAIQSAYISGRQTELARLQAQQ